MIQLNLSGGGTKIVFHYGVVEGLIKKGLKPDVISGVSAGAILALPIAMGKLSDINEIVLNFGTKDFFSIAPFNKKGKLSFGAWIRLIFGYHSLGVQDALLKTLKRVISKEDFEYWKNTSQIQVYVTVVNFNNGKQEVININSQEYEKALQYILASASIPIFAKSVKIDEKYYYDGGVKDHLASTEVMKLYDIKECISVYARPKEMTLKDSWKPKTIFNVLVRTIDVFNISTSESDEEIEEMYCLEKGIKLSKFYCPISLSPYVNDKKILNQLYQSGLKESEQWQK